MEVLTETDVEAKNLDTITTACHHFLPEKTLRRRPPDLPWVTDGTKRLMSQRNHAHHESNVTLCKSLRTRVICEVKLAEKKIYPSELQHLKDADSSKRLGQIMQLWH